MKKCTRVFVLHLKMKYVLPLHVLCVDYSIENWLSEGKQQIFIPSKFNVLIYFALSDKSIAWMPFRLKIDEHQYGGLLCDPGSEQRMREGAKVARRKQIAKGGCDGRGRDRLLLPHSALPSASCQRCPLRAARKKEMFLT